MTAMFQEQTSVAIFKDIETHAAWHGKIPGLRAEKMLRGKKVPYLYLLRTGEELGHYYVTFILPDLSIRHQPFEITITSEGWYYENISGGGPYIDPSIDDVLYLIMHCNKGECREFTPSMSRYV